MHSKHVHGVGTFGPFAMETMATLAAARACRELSAWPPRERFEWFKFWRSKNDFEILVSMSDNRFDELYGAVKNQHQKIVDGMDANERRAFLSLCQANRA